MNRSEIKAQFRVENPEITDRVITDAQLDSWLLQGNLEICCEARLIVDADGTTISTTEDDQTFVLTSEITKFYDIDEYPGGGITYNDKRIEEKTIAQLDQESPNWRNKSSGTPKAYYRRGDTITLDRAIDSEADDLKIYAVLLPNDFDNDDKTPYNELPWLKPFHYALVLYLQKKAKMKVGKSGEETKAISEMAAYIKWMKKMIGGGKYTKISYHRSQAYS